MKALDGTITKEQRAFMTAVQKQGYFSSACFGADAGIRVIEAYMREQLGREVAENIPGVVL
jgi:hypothetical protein